MPWQVLASSSLRQTTWGWVYPSLRPWTLFLIVKKTMRRVPETGAISAIEENGFQPITEIALG